MHNQTQSNRFKPQDVYKFFIFSRLSSRWSWFEQDSWCFPIKNKRKKIRITQNVLATFILYTKYANTIEILLLYLWTLKFEAMLATVSLSQDL